MAWSRGALCAVVLGVVGCSGSGGEARAPEVAPTLAQEPPGASCTSGGLKLVVAGQVRYLCNGAPGAGGTAATVTLEPAGARCATGGLAIAIGADPTMTYVCAPAGTAVSSEPAGPSCPGGGVRLQVGAAAPSFLCSTLAHGFVVLGAGSGGGGAGDYFADYGRLCRGGDGRSRTGTVLGTPMGDVIFGDGSGGGAGGSGFRSTAGGVGGGGATVIDGGAGDDVIFGDGFGGCGASQDLNGGAGGLGGGGGGGGAYPVSGGAGGSGGNGGLLAGGGGALPEGTVGISLLGGSSGGLASKPAGGTSGNPGDNGWGGNGAIPAWGHGQSKGGTTNNSWAAGGGAGFGGVNDQSQYIDIATRLTQLANGGQPQGGSGSGGADAVVAWADAAGALHAYVLAEVVNGRIYASTPGTTCGQGAGNDTINGGPGSDHLFGMGGNDVFVFERSEAGPLDTDTIWDFDKLGTDKLRLTIDGALISSATRDALIAAQAPSGADRILSFTDGATHRVDIVVKALGRNLVAADFE